MYVGDDGVYTYTFQHQRKPECPVCGSEPQKMVLKPTITLQDLIDLLLEYKEM